MLKKHVCLALVALLLLAGQSQAAILNAGLAPGVLNFLNDNDVDRYIGSGTFAVGDVFESLGIVDNLGGTPITTKVGDPEYQLTFHSVLTVTSVTPAEQGGGLVDLALSGTVHLRETSTLAQHMDFSVDFDTSLAQHLTQSDLLLLTSDFYQQKGAPATVAGVPVFPPLVADGGFTVSANAGGVDGIPVPFVPDGASSTYDPINGVFGPTVTTFHDVVVRVQLFTNTGASLDPTEFPLLTDTTAQFLAPGVIPEAASALIWAGIIAVSSILGWRRLR
jgi:hypothetical protein